MLLRICLICLLSWIQFPSQAQSEVWSIGGTKYVVEGEDIYLECFHTGDSSSVHFYKGEEMEEFGQMAGAVLIRPQVGSIWITIDNAHRNDSGPYWCGHDREDAKSVNVLIAPDGYVVKASGSEQVWPGCPMVVHCTIVGNRRQVEWFKDGVRVDRGSGVNPLRLRNPTVDDSGLYECRTPINSTGTIRVQVSADEGTDVKINGTGYVSVGCTLMLKCEVEADPEGVNWYQDDIPIDPRLYSGQCSYPPLSILDIDAVSRSDAGRYECRTQSGAAQFFHVYVSEGDITSSGATEVQEGDALELSCEVMGQAGCFSNWWKDGERIDPEHDPHRIVTSSQISDHLARATLRIPRTTLADEGWYRCGTLGGKTRLFRVHIEHVEEVVEISGTVNVVEGDEIKLVCFVRGTIASDVTWYRDGTTLVNRLTNFVQDDSLISFFKRRASMEDAGSYSCRTPDGAMAFIKVQVFESDGRM